MLKQMWVLGALGCMASACAIAGETYDADAFRLPTQHVKAAPVDVNFWMVRDAPTQPLEAYPGVQAGPEKWKDLKAKPVVVAKPAAVKPEEKSAATSSSPFSKLVNFFKGGEQKTVESNAPKQESKTVAAQPAAPIVAKPFGPPVTTSAPLMMPTPPAQAVNPVPVLAPPSHPAFVPAQAPGAKAVPAAFVPPMIQPAVSAQTKPVGNASAKKSNEDFEELK